MTSAYSRALNYLGYRARTVAEIQEYLRRKNYLEEEIQAAISRLLKLKFLDDHLAASTWLDARLATRPIGRKIAAWELKKRGIAQDVIEEVLSQFFQDDVEFQAALDLFNKAKTLPERNKFLRRLYSRGFTRQTIEKVDIHIFGRTDA